MAKLLLCAEQEVIVERIKNIATLQKGMHKQFDDITFLAEKFPEKLRTMMLLECFMAVTAEGGGE